MSRIGDRPIAFPEGVTVDVAAGNVVTVKGPKGELTRALDAEMKLEKGEDAIVVQRPSDSKKHRAMHGTTRSLLENMITGVSKGFEKVLELEGVGYRAQLKGDTLVLNLGYSHPVEFKAEEGMEIEVPENTKVIIRGISRERVGALASNIRQVRPPEPYKGKGVRYAGEHIRRKEGKTGK